MWPRSDRLRAQGDEETGAAIFSVSTAVDPKSDRPVSNCRTLRATKGPANSLETFSTLKSF